MSREIIPFQFEAREIRVIRDENDEPWFVAKDVCESFGDTNYRRSVGRLDDDEKGVSQMYTPGGTQDMVIVNEAGLYSLLFYMQPQKGNLPEEETTRRSEFLKRFKRWVTHDVLPSLRKTGQYAIAPPQPQTQPDLSLAAKCGEAKVVVDVFLEIGKMVGTEPAMAKAIAIQQAERISGLNFTPLLAGNKVEVVPVSVTELGQYLGGIGPKLVNKALAAAGLQVKENEDWKPTEKAEGLYSMTPYKSSHSNHCGYRILWFPEVANKLKAMVSANALQ